MTIFFVFCHIKKYHKTGYVMVDIKTILQKRTTSKLAFISTFIVSLITDSQTLVYMIQSAKQLPLHQLAKNKKIKSTYYIIPFP